MSNLRTRVGTLVLAATVLTGVVAPLSAGSAAAATSPLAGSAGPTPLFPHTATDTWKPAVPAGVDVDAFMRHPVLSWNPITSLPVTRYRVQLSPNADWTNNQVDLPNNGVTVATQFELPTTLPHASYFWRVRGEDADGHYTKWSGALDSSSDWQFTRTWDSRPEVLGSTLADGSIRLSWAPLDDASAYQIQISNNAGFPEPAIADSWTVNCYTNHTRWSLSSATTEAAVVGPCEDMQRVLTALNSGVTMYWHVRGIDGTKADAVPTETSGPCMPSGADCSGWSTPPASFVQPDTTGSPAAPATNLKVNCADTVSGGSLPLCWDTPTMSWDAVPGADGYIVDVAVDPMFTVLYRSYGVWNAHSLTPRDSYLDNQAGRSYYWRVIPCDYAGSGNSFLNCTTTREDATVAAFHKQSAALPRQPASTSSSTLGHDGLYVTVNNAETFAARTLQVRTDRFTFHWDGFLASVAQRGIASTQEAMNYVLQYADNADFDGAHNVLVDATRWTPRGVLPDGTYYWRVQPVDGSDNHLTWSATAAFVKGTVPPVAQIASSAPLSPFQKVKISFSSPVSGVSTSTVGVKDARTGSHLAGSVSVADAGTAYFTPAKALTPGERLAVWVASSVHDLAGNTAKASSEVVRVNRVVDNASSLVKENWQRLASSNASGGHYARSASKADRLTFSFTGNAVRLYGVRTTSGGYGDVLVDGTRKATVNFHASSTRWRQLVYSASVPSGHHTVAVVVRGSHPTGSSGNNVYVDSLGTGVTTLQEQGSGVVQRWSNHRSTDASAGSFDAESGFLAGSGGDAPAFSVRVDGTSVAVYGCMSPDSGNMGVWLDGTYQGRVDLYQSYSTCGQKVFGRSVAAGPHTVTVRPLGTHRSGAKGTRVAVDRVVAG